MTKIEEQALAEKCKAEGLEFSRRRWTRESSSFEQSLRIVGGPPEALTEGKVVVFARPSDGALKQYIVGPVLWEGQGQDGKPRRLCDLVYVRRTLRRPFGRCRHCKEKHRSSRMRCSGTGLFCDPILSAS